MANGAPWTDTDKARIHNGHAFTGPCRRRSLWLRSGAGQRPCVCFFTMDKRGEGVPIILERSEQVSGIRPAHRLVDDSELLLVIWATVPPGLE